METTARQAAGLKVREPQSGKVVQWCIGIMALPLSEVLFVVMGVLGVTGAEVVR